MQSAVIVIPQWGRSDLTLGCIRSLRRFESTPVLVVDDGSPASDRTAIQRAELSAVELLPRPHQGVTAAWNAALNHLRQLKNAAPPTIVFLNNDVVTTGPWLDTLTGPLLFGPTLITGAAWRKERNVAPARLPTNRFLEGWCFAISFDALQDLGGFDPRLKTYFSDTDLQCRLVERYGDVGTRIAIPLPLQHLAHQTAGPYRTRRPQWHQDRQRFVKKWSKVFKPQFNAQR
jgi:GT2 family glycosyltransferase